MPIVAGDQLLVGVLELRAVGVLTYSALKAGVNILTLLPGPRAGTAPDPGERHRARLLPRRSEPGAARREPGRGDPAAHAAGRLGEPDDLVGTMIWLASERASGFVTGALIRVDGGFGAMTI